MHKKITVKIDRAMGTYHPEHRDLYYPVNYGYIEGVFAPDGEEQDAYVLGVDKPIDEFTGILYAVIHRKNDVEDKWVVVPDGYSPTKEEIKELVNFQEQYFDIEIELIHNNHKVFGAKEDEEYTDRAGAYLIAIKDGKIAVVKTDKGYFLLGGGIENGETDIDCIKRECLEETGCTAIVKEQICSAETYCLHSKIGYFHPIQRYYTGELTKKLQPPTESDHKLVWAECNEIAGKMFSEMQGWAIEQALNM